MKVNCLFHTLVDLTLRKDPRYALYRGLSGPQTWRGRLWLLPGIELQFLEYDFHAQGSTNPG